MLISSDINMVEEQNNRNTEYLHDLINKVVVCETLSGKPISGVLEGFNKYELVLIDAKNMKLKKPVRTTVYKHGLVSIKELE